MYISVVLTLIIFVVAVIVIWKKWLSKRPEIRGWLALDKAQVEKEVANDIKKFEKNTNKEKNRKIINKFTEGKND